MRPRKTPLPSSSTPCSAVARIILTNHVLAYSDVSAAKMPAGGSIKYNGSLERSGISEPIHTIALDV